MYSNQWNKIIIFICINHNGSIPVTFFFSALLTFASEMNRVTCFSLSDKTL